MPLRTKTIRQKILINASPNAVYDALLDPKKQAAFTKQKATANRRVGRKFTVMDDYITGKNLVLEKGRHIVQEWKTNEWPDGYGPSNLDLTLRKISAGTEVKMIHSRVPTKQAEHYEKGWTEYYFNPLKEYFRKY